MVGVWKDGRCFFDDLSTLFEKLAFRVLFDLNILPMNSLMKERFSLMIYDGRFQKEWRGKAFGIRVGRREAVL